MYFEKYCNKEKKKKRKKCSTRYIIVFLESMSQVPRLGPGGW